MAVMGARNTKKVGAVMLEVYIDGACLPNPGGTASYGLVVYQDGIRRMAKGQAIGEGPGFSNNVAEYAGLLEFLRLWKGLEPAKVYSDSQLLVKQMSGVWEARGGLYWDSYLEAVKLCQDKPISFFWIPKEDNSEADWYSMQAL